MKLDEFGYSAVSRVCYPWAVSVPAFVAFFRNSFWGCVCVSWFCLVVVVWVSFFLLGGVCLVCFISFFPSELL